MLLLWTAVLALAAPASSPSGPAVLTADLDGTGRTVTATARARGKAVRLEIADEKGKRLAAADAPAPRGVSAVRLAGGVIGSPGTLIELVAAGPDEECRSFWRFREGQLARLPVQRGSENLADCARPDGWTTTWEKKADDKPAVWVRARANEMPRGTHREREVYAFSGFSIDFDPARSSAEIAGVEIPVWNDNTLYTPTALDNLKNRFDLKRIRTDPRLRVRTDRARGVFSIELSDRSGHLEAPVTASARGLEPDQINLTVATETGKASARVTVRGAVVTDVIVAGISPKWDGGYQPASRLVGPELVIYAQAEDDLASNDLVGLWASDKEQLALNLVPGALGAVDMRKAQLDVSIDLAPADTDALLLPRDGTAPAWAIVLKGANGLDRVPVRCGTRTAGSWSCEREGPAVSFHRVGGRMNAR